MSAKHKAKMAVSRSVPRYLLSGSISNNPSSPPESLNTSEKEGKKKKSSDEQKHKKEKKSSVETTSGEKIKTKKPMIDSNKSSEEKSAKKARRHNKLKGHIEPDTEILCRRIAFQKNDRRKKTLWSSKEVTSLIKAVDIYGAGNWARIKKDPEFKELFQRRTGVDLKDKWRNIASEMTYDMVPVRKYVLVDENHQPILSKLGNPHIFRNKWPRDAAAKVCSHPDWFFTEVSEPQVLRIKELVDENSESRAGQVYPPVVHVYTCHRNLVESPNISKFAGLNHVWRPDPIKIREEVSVIKPKYKNQ